MFTRCAVCLISVLVFCRKIPGFQEIFGRCRGSNLQKYDGSDPVCENLGDNSGWLGDVSGERDFQDCAWVQAEASRVAKGER